jgi:hypothetical protein
VAFLSVDLNTPMFVVDRLVDALFVSDIAVTCNLVAYDARAKAHIYTRVGVLWKCGAPRHSAWRARLR